MICPCLGNSITVGRRFGLSHDASIASMATLTIRQLDEKTKTRLRVGAAQHGRSMEEEAREILRSALTSLGPQRNLAEVIYRRFGGVGGIELDLPSRDAIRQPTKFPE